MRVLAELHPARKEVSVDLAAPSTGMDLFRVLALPPDAHLLLRGETPLPADEPLRDGERIRVIAVASGG